MRGQVYLSSARSWPTQVGAIVAPQHWEAIRAFYSGFSRHLCHACSRYAMPVPVLAHDVSFLFIFLFTSTSIEDSSLVV